MGIEQEFAVRSDLQQVDFAAWAREGRLTGCRLDRADPHAHRQPGGGVITADGQEAEVATAPALLRPGFSSELLTALADLRFRLAVIAAEATVTGVSTHLNVEVDDRRVRRCADRFAHRHAAAMMLLTDRRESPGLLVRPRRGRLELGGEYAVGTQLRTAAVFAAAATLESDLDALRGRARPLTHARLVPARERFGWYVDRSAFGDDLYSGGRRARVGPGSLRAQDLLAWSWEQARPLASRVACEEEIALVDAAVEGRAALPCEQVEEEQPPAPDRSPAVDVTSPRTWGELVLRPVVLTWEHAVFALEADGGSVVLAVPAGSAVELVTSFAAGSLADWCRDALGTPARLLPVLADPEQVGSGGVFAAVAPGADLMAPERDAITGLVGGSGGATRQHKHDNRDDPSHRPSRVRRLRGLRHHRLLAGAAAGVLVLAGAGTVGAVAVHHRHQAEAAAARAHEQQTAARQAEAAKARRAAAVSAARSYAGSYAVVSRVTKGNATSPAGTVSRYRMHVKVTCSAQAACTADIGAGPKVLSGDRLHFVDMVEQPCRVRGGKAGVRQIFDLTFGPAVFSGTVRASAVDLSRCPGVKNIPIVEALTGRAVR